MGRKIPESACKLFRGGKIVERIHGMQTEADYRTLIERHLLPLASQVQAAAIKAWQQGDEDKAISPTFVSILGFQP